MSRKAVVVASDLHCGSTVALCGNGPIELADNQIYMPSKQQKWLYENWKLAWAWVAELLRREGIEDWMLALNGDLVDGDHHQTHQIISKSSYLQTKILHDVMRHPLDLEPTKVLVVRGTEAHVGKGGSSEESFAQALKHEGFDVIPSSVDVFSHWHKDLDINGCLMDFTHHGQMGHRPWTRLNAANRLAAEVIIERHNEGSRIPDIVWRSHYHRHLDSYNAHRVRVIQTGAWQLRTSYVSKKHPEGLADIALHVAIVNEDGSYEVHHHIIKPTISRGEVTTWK